MDLLELTLVVILSVFNCNELHGMFFKLPEQQGHSLVKPGKTLDRGYTSLHDSIHSSEFCTIFFGYLIRVPQRVVKVHERIFHNAMDLTNVDVSIHLEQGSLGFYLVLQLLLVICQPFVHHLDFKHSFNFLYLFEINSTIAPHAQVRMV